VLFACAARGVVKALGATRMFAERLPTALLIIGLSVVSGLADSRGFVHAARIWQGGRLVPQELGRSALGFAVGISCYWLSVKYLQVLGVLAPETQTLIWFTVTLIGVALASGKFLRWHMLDQVVAAGVLLGLGWLLCRTGG
jgi:hypothetical protein